MKKIKVLHILNTTDMGGAERVLLDICRHTNKKEFELVIVSFQKGRLENEFKKFNYVKKIDLKDNSYFNLISLKKLNNIVKDEKIDIIQTHLQKPELYGFLLKILNPNIKLVIKKGNTDDYRTKWFWRLSNGFIHIFADLIIPTSNGVKEFSHKYEFISYKKMRTIYSGIDIQKINQKIKKCQPIKLKKILKVKRKNITILSVGRLVYQKGFNDLLEVSHLLLRKNKEFKILISGDGPLKNQIIDQIKKNNLEKYIKLLGDRKDVIDLLKISKIFCLASVKEGIPIAVMESMYLGVPVVSTKVGGNAELIKTGHNGFLEEPKKPYLLSRRIEQLLNDSKLKNKIIKNARQTILQRFSIKNTTKNYEREYKQLVLVKKHKIKKC